MRLGGVEIGALTRRGLALYLVFTAVGTQVCFLVDTTTGVPIAPARMVWILAAFFPIAAALVALAWSHRRSPPLAPDVPWRETLLGVGAWCCWAGSYFVVGALVDPHRLSLLPDTIERRLPLWPSFSLLYVAVYPLAMLPWFWLRDRSQLRGLLHGWIAIVALSDVVFLLVPVAMRRPDLAELPASFGRWTLSVIHSADPPSNCMPSTHCAMALYAALAILREDRRLGTWAVATSLAIGLSTLLVKQHYAVDVLAGYAIAIAARWLFVPAASAGRQALAEERAGRTQAS